MPSKTHGAKATITVSIRNRDVPSFDRYFSQLQSFYTDYSESLPPSKREYPIRILNVSNSGAQTLVD
ncbi:hypothetical protein CPC08DRAFT_428957 [Agrocybe pediades]|nr:hypothetical protein CPC08DRAFT_428957 [Agrocybe pediades]